MLLGGLITCYVSGPTIKLPKPPCSKMVQRCVADDRPRHYEINSEMEAKLVKCPWATGES